MKKPFINKTCKLCLVLMILGGLSVLFGLPTYAAVCYQETANLSTYCFSNITYGNYSTVCDGAAYWSSNYSLWDGNYSSYASVSGGTSCYLFINYTKSTLIKNATWQVKYTANAVDNIINISLPYSCLNYSIDKIVLKIDESPISYLAMQCLNQSGSFITLRSFSGNPYKLYEEGLYYDYQEHIDNCTNILNYPTNGTAREYYWKTSAGALAPINLSTSIILTENVTYYQSINNISKQQYCIYPSWLSQTGNLSLTYAYGDALYSYYTTNSIFNNVTSFYNFTIDTGTTDITATVYDETNKEVEGAYIYVQKYDSATGNYNLVGIYATNFEGKVVIPLIMNTQYYKFLIYYPATTLLETTTPTYIYATTINFQIKISPDILQDYYTKQGINGNLTFNDDTFKFRFIYVDPSASVTQSCVYVYLQSAMGNTLFNSSCATGSSATILVGVANTTATSYYALATVFINGVEQPYDSLTKYFGDLNARDSFGYMIIIIDIILTIAFAFILTFSIPLAVILIPLPTLFLSLIHMLDIDPNVALGVELAALVVAIIINRRG